MFQENNDDEPSSFETFLKEFSCEMDLEFKASFGEANKFESMFGLGIADSAQEESFAIQDHTKQHGLKTASENRKQKQRRQNSGDKKLEQRQKCENRKQKQRHNSEDKNRERRQNCQNCDDRKQTRQQLYGQPIIKAYQELRNVIPKTRKEKTKLETLVLAKQYIKLLESALENITRIKQLKYKSYVIYI